MRAQFLAFFFSCQEKNEKKEKKENGHEAEKKKRKKSGPKHHKKRIQAFHMAHSLKNRSILHSIFAKCM